MQNASASSLAGGGGKTLLGSVVAMSLTSFKFIQDHPTSTYEVAQGDA
jgi:hypothetical protein